VEIPQHSPKRNKPPWTSFMQSGSATTIDDI
jgi:hypothetical protein